MVATRMPAAMPIATSAMRNAVATAVDGSCSRSERIERKPTLPGPVARAATREHPAVEMALELVANERR